MSHRKSELYFEEIGDCFGSWMSPYDVVRRTEMIMRFMPERSSEMHCLEVGCGTGAISNAIAPRVQHLMVCDMSAKLAESTGARLGVDWSMQDACNLEFPDESFDMVISSECIEHTPDPCRALAEMARVLKKGGVLIVTSPNKVWYPVLWLTSILKIRNFEGNEIWLYPFQAARVLKNAKLGEIKLSGCHLFPWQIPCLNRLLPFFDKWGSILYPGMINYGVRAVKSK